MFSLAISTTYEISRKVHQRRNTAYVHLPHVRLAILFSYLRKDGVDRNLLLEQAAGEVHLSGDVTTVDLNLADVRLLLPQLDKSDLNTTKVVKNRSAGRNSGVILDTTLGCTVFNLPGHQCSGRTHAQITQQKGKKTEEGGVNNSSAAHVKKTSLVRHVISRRENIHCYYLGVGDNANDLGVLLDAAELGVDLLRCLSELLSVPGERLLLGRVPVLVEPCKIRTQGKKNLF